MEAIAVYSPDPDKAAILFSVEGFTGFACDRLDVLAARASSGICGLAADIPLMLQTSGAGKQRLDRLSLLLPFAPFRILRGRMLCSVLDDFRIRVAACGLRKVRAHDRRPLMCPVVVDGTRCVTRDVSPAGAFVIHPDPPMAGARVRFETVLAGKSLRGLAEVVWRRSFEESCGNMPPGMGIRFCNYDSEMSSFKVTEF